MAGRILPLALATIVGVSIGVATFDSEFKEQRRKRLQEEYDRYVEQYDSYFTATHTADSEVAAAAALNSQSTTPMASNAISPPAPQQLPAPLVGAKEDPKVHTSDSTSSWSSMLGLWAWDKNYKNDVAPGAQKPAPSQSKVDETVGKP
jgi:hypothetical protein